MKAESVLVGPVDVAVELEREVKGPSRERVPREPDAPSRRVCTARQLACFDARAVDDQTDPHRPPPPDADPVERQLEHGPRPGGNAADCQGEHGARPVTPDPAGVGQPPSRTESAEVLEPRDARCPSDAKREWLARAGESIGPTHVADEVDTCGRDALHRRASHPRVRGPAAAVEVRDDERVQVDSAAVDEQESPGMQSPVETGALSFEESFERDHHRRVAAWGTKGRPRASRPGRARPGTRASRRGRSRRSTGRRTPRARPARARRRRRAPRASRRARARERHRRSGSRSTVLAPR